MTNLFSSLLCLTLNIIGYLVVGVIMKILHNLYTILQVTLSYALFAVHNAIPLDMILPVSICLLLIGIQIVLLSKTKSKQQLRELRISAIAWLLRLKALISEGSLWPRDYAKVYVASLASLKIIWIILRLSMLYCLDVIRSTLMPPNKSTNQLSEHYSDL